MAILIGERPSQAIWRDYLELTKPKVVVLMLITSLVGMFLATRAGVPWTVLLFGNLGIALCAGGAAAVNHVVDRRIDAVMARTHKRPLAEGRVTPAAALTFALVLAVLGQALLLAFTNPLTAWLTLASLLGYAVVYTGFLKRATPQNIVIGGLAGAAPPLLGWTAATGHVSAEPLLLVLIIFAWTPPHFWALAIHRKEEYAKADIPMLPVTHGPQFTRLSILLYTLLLRVRADPRSIDDAADPGVKPPVLHGLSKFAEPFGARLVHDDASDEESPEEPAQGGAHQKSLRT